jgi:hypothetical protein
MPKTHPHDAELAAKVPMAVLCYSSGVMVAWIFHGGKETSWGNANPWLTAMKEFGVKTLI